jgi:prepilin-type N-terminal cleavage/methylation domain-containing protein/prepilin-type processing-associated H-X9-DG protein
MKTFLSTKPDRGLTLIELLVVIALVAIIAAMVPASFSNAKPRALRIQCVSNLKQTGLAYRVWAGDNSINYPMGLSETNGGTREFITGLNAFRHFQIMSNELSTPKIIFCPAETDRNRFVATTNWNINNSNISYFVGVDAVETNEQMILSGDHNITNGTPVKNGLLALTTNQLTGWTTEMHNKVGNIAMTDGSVQQISSGGLREFVENTDIATNRLQMPILSP